MTHADNADFKRLEILWGKTSERRRGPKPTLSVEHIAQAAIGFAKAEGLEALSMKRLAEVLNVGTMTLYTYVPDKTTLLQLMLDRAVTGLELPTSSVDWRQHLRRSAETLFTLYLEHPWMLQVIVDAPPITPGQMRYLESMLRALRDTGLTGSESLDVSMSLSYYVLGAAKLSSGILAAERDSSLHSEELQANYAAAFERFLDPAEFPTVLMAMTEPRAEISPSEGIWDHLGFHFGLERLIDGVAAYIARQAPPGSGQ